MSCDSKFTVNEEEKRKGHRIIVPYDFVHTDEPPSSSEHKYLLQILGISVLGSSLPRVLKR